MYPFCRQVDDQRFLGAWCRIFGTFTVRKLESFKQEHALNTLARAVVMIDRDILYTSLLLIIPYNLLHKLPYTILTII